MSGSLAALWLPGWEVKGWRQVCWTFSLLPLSKCHPGTISVGFGGDASCGRGWASCHGHHWRRHKTRRHTWTLHLPEAAAVQRDAERSRCFLFLKGRPVMDAFMDSVRIKREIWALDEIQPPPSHWWFVFSRRWSSLYQWIPSFCECNRKTSETNFKKTTTFDPQKLNPGWMHWPSYLDTSGWAASPLTIIVIKGATSPKRQKRPV